MNGVTMTVDQEFAVAPVRDAAGSKEIHSVAWWESRTAEQLRGIIKRGFAGGPDFPAAVTEMERRAREGSRRLHEAAATEAASRSKRKKIVWGSGTSVLAIAALLGFWLAR